jgi:hypothetical protein
LDQRVIAAALIAEQWRSFSMEKELEELRILAEHMAASLEDVYDSTAVLNHLGLNQNERLCESLSAYRAKYPVKP